MSENTVYITAQVQVENWGLYQSEYLPTTFERITAHDGEVLVATEEAEELEGEWDGNWTVIIQFPSEQRAYEFMEDETYTNVMSARHKASEWSDIALLPGFSQV
jgi:uncharacterized protein (DUF1330 family)